MRFIRIFATSTETIISKLDAHTSGPNSRPTIDLMAGIEKIIRELFFHYKIT